MEFAERHKHWTISDWKNVIWSDYMNLRSIDLDPILWNVIYGVGNLIKVS